MFYVGDSKNDCGINEINYDLTLSKIFGRTIKKIYGSFYIFHPKIKIRRIQCLKKLEIFLPRR